MISDTTRSRNPAGHAGLRENLLALASALTEFFEGRFALFAQESKAPSLVAAVALAKRLNVTNRGSRRTSVSPCLLQAEAGDGRRGTLIPIRVQSHARPHTLREPDIARQSYRRKPLPARPR
jgi:hypothetical protein